VIGLGWIRIEPHTEIARMAVAAGLIAPGTDLLPAHEAQLRHLFYCRNTAGWVDFLVLRVFRAIEGSLKPRVKRLVDRLRGRRGVERP
jgi:hypothetical protein